MALTLLSGRRKGTTSSTTSCDGCFCVSLSCAAALELSVRKALDRNVLRARREQSKQIYAFCRRLDVLIERRLIR